MDEDELYRLLFPEKVAAADAPAKPLPDWEHVRKELKKRSVTLRLFWDEYWDDHPNGYGYSQYCELHRRYVQKLDPPTRQKHKAGEKLFVHEVCNLKKGAPLSQHCQRVSRVHKGHGRIEKRTILVSTELNDYLD